MLTKILVSGIGVVNEKVINNISLYMRLIEGIYKLLVSNISDPVNIGNPKEMTILELSELILKITESNGEIRYEALPQDDPQTRQPDITKARTLLNWEPIVPVEEGLKTTIDWFKNKGVSS